MTAAKHTILSEIKRLAEARGGKPPGIPTFERETGIKRSNWFPQFWVRWGDALKEAGFAPNRFFQASITNEVLLRQYALFAQRLGHLPVTGEMQRESKADPSFPHPGTFYEHFRGKDRLLNAVAGFCRANAGFGDVLGFCEGAVNARDNEARSRSEKQSRIRSGFVYLMKSGPHYKIGRTNSLGRREWELGIKIPVPPRTIHYIETDDPVGIEAYWHRRFEAKRGEGEWFNLTVEEVEAFKRWKRIV